MNIKLDCGLTVEVDSFSFNYTYSGLLLGRPDEKMNRSIFETADYPAEWGERKVLKIKPTLQEFQTKLKRVKYCVWLDSIYNNGYSHGTLLVVIWFGDPPDGRTIESIITAGVKHIDWKKEAEGYFF